MDAKPWVLLLHFIQLDFRERSKTINTVVLRQAKSKAVIND